MPAATGYSAPFCASQIGCDLQITHHATPPHRWSQSWMKLFGKQHYEVLSQNSTKPLLLFKSPLAIILMRRKLISSIWDVIPLLPANSRRDIKSQTNLRPNSWSCFILLGIKTYLCGSERRKEELFGILKLNEQAPKTALATLKVVAHEFWCAYDSLWHFKNADRQIQVGRSIINESVPMKYSWGQH